MNRQSAGAKWVSFVVVSTVLILGIMWGIDRPLAQAAHDLSMARYFAPLTHLVDPLAPVASVIVVLTSAGALLGWRPGPMVMGLLWIAVAVLAAGVIKEELKYVFGRTWPETWTSGNPSYIHDHVFAFVPFHGGKGWASFPSGHMSVSVAAAAAAWPTFRRCRWIGAGLALLIAVGLLGANYHWLSDIAAGTLLGAVVGAGVTALGQHVSTARLDRAAPGWLFV